MGSRGPVLASVLCVLLVVAAGCGEEEGVAEGAVVTAYVAEPLCAEAEQELARAGGQAGEVRVRSVCLGGSGEGGVDLTAAGANARRASEDSSAVGYLEPPSPATRFSRPILEAAGIAHIAAGSGKRGMARLLGALRGAGDTDSPREAVAEAIGGS